MSVEGVTKRKKDDCWAWQANPHFWHEQAAVQAVEDGFRIMPWTQIELTCETECCLNSRHMLFHAPKRLEYPRGVCVYCGVPSGTQDHLLPKTITGKAARKHVLTVPACAECNTIINDKYAPSITARRRIAHAGIRRKYKGKLNVYPYTPEELSEFGHALRSTIVRGMQERDALLDRLAFPGDESYDLYFLAKSGIDDPYALGLIEPRSEDDRAPEGPLEVSEGHFCAQTGNHDAPKRRTRVAKTNTEELS